MTRFFCAILFSLFALSAHAEKVKVLNAALSLDSAGKVSEVQFKGQVAPSLESALRTRISSWKFSPVLVQGQPRAATVNLHMNLGFEPNGDRMQVRIISAGTGLGVVKLKAPRYPRRELRRSKNGNVVLRLLVGPDGNVIEAIAIDSTSKLFERAALKAASTYFFEPLLVDGVPARAEIYMPVSFFIAGQQLPLPDLSEVIGVNLDANGGALVAEQGGQLISDDVAASL